MRHFTASLRDFACSRFVPCMQPSFSTHVNKSSSAYFSAAFAPSSREIPTVSVQPFTAIFPLIASTEIIIRSLPIAAVSSSRKAVLRISPFFCASALAHAEEPTMTFSAPSEISSFARLTERTPPPVRTFPLRKRLFNKAVFGVSPFSFMFPSAASRSITATSPYKSKSLIRASASVRSSIFSLPFFS